MKFALFSGGEGGFCGESKTTLACGGWAPAGYGCVVALPVGWRGILRGWVYVVVAYVYE